MRKKGVICLVLSLLVAMTSVFHVLASEVQPDSQSQNAGYNSSYSTDAQVGILGSEQLIENAKSVFLYETNSDTLMYAWNPDEQMIPSSLVKIMTALLAIEKGSLTDAVTATQTVLDMIPKDAVTADIVADEVMTLEDLIYCMMVGSANDAAAVIAEHVGGSQLEFVRMMNARAVELGCTGTEFTNAHGIQDNIQHSTARDVAKILDAALENETFAKIFGSAYCLLDATNKSEERNYLTNNYLISQDDLTIYYDPRVTGGRTGVNNDGTRCIASVSESNGMKLICVVMGSQSTLHEESFAIKAFGGFNETRELLDIGYGGYKTAQILYAGQTLTQRTVLNGSSTVSLGCDVFVSAVLPEKVTTSELTYRYTDTGTDLTAPIKKGDKVSSVEVWYGNLCIAQADLYAMNSVREAKSVVVFKDTGGFPWWGVLLIILGVGVAAFLYLVLVRFANKSKAMAKKKRDQRYARNRRRSR